MTDARSDDTADSPPHDAGDSPRDATVDSPPDAAPISAEERAALERRAFVRRMGTDAVRTAGSVFGLSRILTRTAVGVSQQVVGGLERLQVGNAADEVEPVIALQPAPEEQNAIVPSAVQAEPVASAPVASEPVASAPTPARSELRIDPTDRALLEAAASAVIAVNREGHPPQLTAARVHWDGGTLRFLTLGWSRRTTMLRADPRIGAFIDGDDGRFVTVAGRAHIVDDRTVRDEAWPLLLRDHGSAEAAAAAWDALVADDLDRAVIVIEPEQVLAGRR